MRAEYPDRSRFERLNHQLTRHGARQARAWGLAAANLQAHAIAMRCNLQLLAEAYDVENGKRRRPSAILPNPAHGLVRRSRERDRDRGPAHVLRGGPEREPRHTMLDHADDHAHETPRAKAPDGGNSSPPPRAGGETPKRS